MTEIAFFGKTCFTVSASLWSGQGSPTSLYILFTFSSANEPTCFRYPNLSLLGGRALPAADGGVGKEVGPPTEGSPCLTLDCGVTDGVMFEKSKEEACGCDTVGACCCTCSLKRPVLMFMLVLDRTVAKEPKAQTSCKAGRKISRETRTWREDHSVRMEKVRRISMASWLRSYESSKSGQVSPTRTP